MRIGSVVTYKTFDNSVRTVKVTEMEQHNGRLSFTGVLLDDEGLPVRDETNDNRPVMVWGYSSQAFQVVY